MSRRSWPSKRPNVPPDPLVPRSKPASAPALEAVEHKYAPFDAAGPRPETLAAMSTPETAGDEYILDTPTVRDFIASVREAIATAGSAEEACDAIRPGFARLLADPEWLAPEYQRDAPASGMGGGIGQWLLFRSADRSLTLFSLVVPSGAQTPVHDHLAWGLVGLYRGTQDEEIYGGDDDGCGLVLRERRGSRTLGGWSRQHRFGAATSRRDGRARRLVEG